MTDQNSVQPDAQRLKKLERVAALMRHEMTNMGASGCCDWSALEEEKRQALADLDEDMQNTEQEETETIAEKDREIKQLEADLEEQSAKAHRACERSVAYSKERKGLLIKIAALRKDLSSHCQSCYCMGALEEDCAECGTKALLASDSGKAELERVKTLEAIALAALNVVNLHEIYIDEMRQSRQHHNHQRGVAFVQLREALAKLYPASIDPH